MITDTSLPGDIVVQPGCIGEVGQSVRHAEFTTLAGVICGAHGVAGSIRLRCATPTSGHLLHAAPKGNASPDALDGQADKSVVCIGPEPGVGRMYRLLTLKWQEAKRLYLIRLAGVNDRTSAERLTGLSMYAPQDRRAPLEENEFFVEDLIGMEMLSEGGQSFGCLTVIHQAPSSDVWETDQGVLVPAVRAFISSIDTNARVIRVKDLPGLRPTDWLVDSTDAQNGSL